MIAVSEEMKKEDLRDPSNMEQEVSEESASVNTEPVQKRKPRRKHLRKRAFLKRKKILKMKK